jgi:transcriptional regulator with XRE-family HTH domain
LLSLGFQSKVGVSFGHQLSVDRLEIERNYGSFAFGGGQNWGSRGIRGRLVKNPVDLHIGQRVRHRRWLLGMTQQQLAQAVGIRFQQIQKYESGANRISASRLWDLARALDMPISFFFEGLGTGKEGQPGDDGLLQLLRARRRSAAPPFGTGQSSERRRAADVGPRSWTAWRRN